jgi:hypothetical protein
MIAGIDKPHFLAASDVVDFTMQTLRNYPAYAPSLKKSYSNFMTVAMTEGCSRRVGFEIR